MAELLVRVTPRSSVDRVGPVRDGVLLVRVTRPPADGEANAAVVRAVAAALGLPPSLLSVARGSSSRTKRLRVDGLSETALADRLAALPPD